MDDNLARRAYELRLAHVDDLEIARELNISSSAVSELIANYIPAATPTESAENTKARQEEVALLDVWTKRVDAEYRQQNVPIDKAVSSIVRLSERRSKLLGLDSPTRSQIEATLSDSPLTIDEELQKLQEELGL